MRMVGRRTAAGSRDARILGGGEPVVVRRGGAASDHSGRAAGDHADAAGSRPVGDADRHPVGPAGHPVRARRAAGLAADRTLRRAADADRGPARHRPCLRPAWSVPRRVVALRHDHPDERRRRHHAAGAAATGARLAAAAGELRHRALHQRPAGRRNHSGDADAAAAASAARRIPGAGASRSGAFRWS